MERITKPGKLWIMDADPVFLSAKRILQTVFQGDKKHLRIADLGCLEGGYSVEFARMGFEVLGVEVRESNIAACNYVKSKTALPNLSFIKDDAVNIADHGKFDAVFCCGLLYHLDKPKQFIELLSSVTRKLVIIQTHFAFSETEVDVLSALRRRRPSFFKRFWGGKSSLSENKYNLSSLCENEGLPGRWYTEFCDEKAFANRESSKWASWNNRKSFWVRREYLLQTIYDAGFDTVMECFDGLGPRIAESMTNGYYKTDTRGTFIGIKSHKSTLY